MTVGNGNRIPGKILEPTTNLHFKGKYADYVSRENFLDSMENVKRYKVCKFVWANKSGDYDPATGRYDGAIGMLIDGQGDAYIRYVGYPQVDLTKKSNRFSLCFHVK